MDNSKSTGAPPTNVNPFLYENTSVVEDDDKTKRAEITGDENFAHFLDAVKDLPDIHGSPEMSRESSIESDDLFGEVAKPYYYKFLIIGDRSFYDISWEDDDCTSEKDNSDLCHCSCGLTKKETSVDAETPWDKLLSADDKLAAMERFIWFGNGYQDDSPPRIDFDSDDDDDNMSEGGYSPDDDEDIVRKELVKRKRKYCSSDMDAPLPRRAKFNPPDEDQRQEQISDEVNQDDGNLSGGESLFAGISLGLWVDSDEDQHMSYTSSDNEDQHSIAQNSLIIKDSDDEEDPWSGQSNVSDEDDELVEERVVQLEEEFPGEEPYDFGSSDDEDDARFVLHISFDFDDQQDGDRQEGSDDDDDDDDRTSDFTDNDSEDDSDQSDGEDDDYNEGQPDGPQPDESDADEDQRASDNDSDDRMSNYISSDDENSPQNGFVYDGWDERNRPNELQWFKDMNKEPLNKIIGLLDYKSLLVFRKTSKHLRQFIVNVRTDPMIFKLILNVTPLEIVCKIYETEEDLLEINYQKEENGCSVSNQFFENETMFEVFERDISFLLEYQHTRLDTFEVCLSEYKRDECNTKFMEVLQRCFRRRRFLLDVHTVQISCLEQWQATTILQFLSSLETITVKPPPRSVLLGDEREMDIAELVLMDQWREADHLFIVDYYVREPITAFTGFETCIIFMKELTWVTVAGVLWGYTTNPSLRKFRIQFESISGDHPIFERLGQHYDDVEKEAKVMRWYYTTANRQKFFHIDICEDQHYIFYKTIPEEEISPDVIVLDAIFPGGD